MATMMEEVMQPIRTSCQDRGDHGDEDGRSCDQWGLAASGDYGGDEEGHVTNEGLLP